MFAQNNVLQKAMEASWLKNETLSNNIANADTPGYKKQTVQFETYLNNQLSKTNKASLIDLDALNPKVVFENPSYSMKIDENNIDIEVEMAERSKNSLKYSALTDSISNNFKKINTVLSNMK
jgi:flagellar basal-body rod protein FlgB